jgi:hypothetical protein
MEEGIFARLLGSLDAAEGKPSIVNNLRFDSLPLFFQQFDLWL